MMPRAQAILKNVVDRCTAAVLLVLALPLLVYATVVVKLFSRGPILFVQDRVGVGGRPFRIYKFRTMHVRPPGNLDSTVTIRHDPRIFFGGNFLRRSKIDELPQLFNVLNGSMSLVGPRPTVMEDHLRMDERQRQRASVKPGVTGLAQMNGAAGIPWPSRIEYDLQYIADQSLLLDLKIIVMTGWVLMTGRADLNPDVSDEWSTVGSFGNGPAANQRDESRQSDSKRAAA